jgi:hypothetical protein
MHRVLRLVSILTTEHSRQYVINFRAVFFAHRLLCSQNATMTTMSIGISASVSLRLL